MPESGQFGQKKGGAGGSYIGKFDQTPAPPGHPPPLASGGYASPSYGNPPPVSGGYTPSQPPRGSSYTPPPPYQPPPSQSSQPQPSPPYVLGPDDPAYRSHEYVDPVTGRRQRFETVQDRLLNVIGGFFLGFWRGSSTVVRADLVRPYNPRLSKWEGEEDSWEGAQRAERRRRRLKGGRGEALDGHFGGLVQGLDRGFYGNGAQLKLMQIWTFKDKKTGESKLPWDLNFGLGANFDIDNGKLQLKTRLRSEHAVLRLFPRPDLELRGKWRLGNTRLGVDVRYRIPVQYPDQFLESGQGGYLALRLFNWEGAGFSLSPDGGLEFDEQVVRLGNHSKFRVAAKVTFPRYFPWDEDENPLNIEFRRLGLKTTLG